MKIVSIMCSSEGFWEVIEKRLQELRGRIPVVCLSHDPSCWMLSTVAHEIVAKAYAYIVINAEDIFTQMLRFILREVGDMDLAVADPRPIPWEGLYHSQAADIFSSLEEYLAWYEKYRKIDKRKTQRIGAFVKSQSFFLGNSKGNPPDDHTMAREGVDISKKFGVPVFAPITSCYHTITF